MISLIFVTRWCCTYNSSTDTNTFFSSYLIAHDCKGCVQSSWMGTVISITSANCNRQNCKPRCICMGYHMGSHQLKLGSCLKSQVYSRWDPTRDPTWDYGTSHVGSHQLKLGSHMGSHMGSHLKFPLVSHPGKHSPGRIKPGIPQIPLGIPLQISDSFPPGKSYCRRDCTRDPANPCLDSA